MLREAAKVLSVDKKDKTMNNVTIHWSGKENLKGSTFKETVVAVFKEREVAKEFVYALRVSANILEHRNAYIAAVFTNYREYTEVAWCSPTFLAQSSYRQPTRSAIH